MSRITIVNEQDEVIGSKERDEIASEDIYRVSALYVEDKDGNILMAKRATTKKHNPGAWQNAVAGTVEEGESYGRNIIKEAAEEIGIEFDHLLVAHKEFRDGEHKFFCQWYFAIIDQTGDALKRQESEVEELKWFTPEEFKAEFKRARENFTGDLLSVYERMQELKLLGHPKTYIVKNSSDELLDVLIEGNPESENLLLFVHGFGTNKDEGGNLFVDIAQVFSDDFQIVRFDFSGYNLSEGKPEEGSLTKYARDLQSVWNFIDDRFHGKSRYIIAHSLGTFVTSLASLDGIEKAVFTGIPNADTVMMVHRIQERIREKGGVVKTNGISIYPRSSGQVYKVGAEFWNSLMQFHPIDSISRVAHKTKLMIIRPLEDEIVGNEFVEEYKEIPWLSLVEIHGDHNFTKLDDREYLIYKIASFFGVNLSTEYK